MTDLTLSPLRPSGALATLARAAEKLGIPCPPPVDGGEITILGYELRHVHPDKVSITRDGEGGHFDAADLAEHIGRFVTERL